MHIFCDESGGCAPAESCFLTVSVLIDPRQAALVIKRFRKASGIRGEVHGWAMTDEEHKLFFRHLAKHADSVAAAVVCQRATPVGRWAMREMGAREHVLRSTMFAEGCEILSATEQFRRLAATQMNITKDNGRYPGDVLVEARQLTEDQLTRCVASTSFTVGYGDSQSVPGLQVADVIANALSRVLRRGADESTLGPMMAPERLCVRPVRADAYRPAWVIEAA